MVKLGDLLTETINEMEEERMVNAEIISWLNRISTNVEIKSGDIGVDSLRRQFLGLYEMRALMSIPVIWACFLKSLMYSDVMFLSS